MTRWIRHQRACALAAAAFALLGAAACGDSDGGSDSPYGGDSTTGASQSESASPSETAKAETAAALATANDDDHGEFLVDDDGFTLYLFTSDSADKTTCYDACESKWPPLLTDTADVTAGTGVDASLIGTIERTDGTTQVTYNHWPLYYYADDNEPGETDGQGVQDVWFLVAPNGDANEMDS
jgi:predicted lipoprotein with Yx(FWY)xxD motif